MKPMVWRILSGTAVLFALSAAAPVLFAYPPTALHPVTDRYFGTAVTDPYRWLEHPANPTVKAWAKKQSALTLAYLRAQPSYPYYEARVAELAQTSTNRSGLQIAGGHFVYLRQTPPQPQAQLVTRAGIHGDERILFDTQALTNGGTPPAIASVLLSLDGKHVAVTTRTLGTQNETIHVVDVTTGELLPDTIEHVGGSTSPVALLWDGDGAGFLHTQWPRNPDGSVANTHIELWHHVLGTDSSADTYVFGRGLSERAEYHLCGSGDGKYQAAFETDGNGVPGSVYERPSDGVFEQVAAPGDAIGVGDAPETAFVGDRLVVISARRNPHGEAVAIGPGRAFADGVTIVPAGNAILTGIVPVAGGFLTNDIDGGDGSVRFFRSNATPVKLRLPPQSTITALAGDLAGGDIVVGYSGYRTPNAWLLYHARANTLTATGIRQIAPADYSQLVVKRTFVRSLDGKAKIPVEIVSLPGTKTDGTAPTILHAYGAYGRMTRPSFLGTRLAFLERGGVFANAMIRGGGEYGEAWHAAAKLETKTKSSDDLAAVAAWLGTHGYGSAHHLGITGGGAGGFLMGLALTRNTERYRAIDSAAGFYDLLRIDLTPNGAYDTPEFGTVSDPKQFAWMLKQSPYERVVRGRAYPAVLMTTGENDPRVDPSNSRKMIARLQASSTSQLPILLWQSGEGHGIGSSFAQRVADATATLTWFDSQLR